MKKLFLIVSFILMFVSQVDAQLENSFGFRVGGNTDLLLHFGTGYNSRTEMSLGTSVSKKKDSLIDLSLNYMAAYHYTFDLSNEWYLYIGFGAGVGVSLNDIKNKVDFFDIIGVKVCPLVGAEYNLTDSWTAFLEYKPAVVFKGFQHNIIDYELFGLSIGMRYRP